MSKLECSTVKDLLPLYLEDSLSENTKQNVKEHLKQCIDCKEDSMRMQKQLSITCTHQKPDRKILLYLSGIRIWYFLCPFFALLLYCHGLHRILWLYEGILFGFGILCICSQFFSGNSMAGIDYEQHLLQEKAQLRSRKSWGFFRISPLSLAIPALLTVLSIELPEKLVFLIRLFT